MSDLATFLREGNEEWKRMTTIEKLERLIHEEKTLIAPALAAYGLKGPTRILDALESARDELIRKECKSDT